MAINPNLGSLSSLSPLRWLGYWSGLGLWGLVGCGQLVAPPPPLLTPLEEATAAQLPPCVDDDCNCGDFRDQALAQRVLEAFPGDPFVLDRDGNGVACESLPPTAPPGDAPAAPSANPHLLLGNPSHANRQNPNNYLIERDGYALAYDRDRGHAHWVSWQLTTAWLGQTERQDNFRQDGSLPAGFYQVTPNDYRNSGYDRGHLLPSGDRTVSVAANSATFLMTNIIPQAPENNRGLWAELEQYTRQLVRQGDQEVYVIAGAYGHRETLAEGRVTVPSRLWKVIVVLDTPGAGLAGVSAASQVIAVDMPNRDRLPTDWRIYQTALQRIELATGYSLLSAVAPEIQRELNHEAVIP